MADYELIDYNGQQARRYSDGSIRDAHGHMLAPLPGGNTITPETASTLALRRQELKRERLLQAANAAAEQVSSVRGPYFRGDMAFVEALGEAMAQRALDPKDVKGVDAARLLLAETALAEQRAAEQPTQQGISGEALDKLYVIALAALQSHEAQATDAETKDE